ncbi:MAG TPA: shikimate kinase [bacterium]|nr:shikimate kinase [bacterium]
MNIALIGYRGTGKSTIGKIIAECAGMALKNLDAMIAERAGMSIPGIVGRFGWEKFRDRESEVLASAAAGDNQVLDCGGGIILREQNRVKLKAAGPVVWLTASVPAIVARIQGDTQRPSLTGKSFTEEVEEVMIVREPLYRACATYVIDTEAMGPEESAREIIRLVQYCPE